MIIIFFFIRMKIGARTKRLVSIPLVLLAFSDSISLFNFSPAAHCYPSSSTRPQANRWQMSPNPFSACLQFSVIDSSNRLVVN